MADIKTKATERSVDEFIAAVPNTVRRADAERLRALMEEISGEPATMWGPTIIGFGRYRYRYESGHSGAMCRIGFAPRGANTVLYILADFPDQAELLGQLGRHRTSRAGAGCLYLNKLSDIDVPVLTDMIRRAWTHMATLHPN